MADAIEKAGATLQDELDYSYFTGKAEGKAEGKVEGILEGLIRAAKFMLQTGHRPEEIAAGMNMSLDQVRRLQV